ncbi:MAG: hypothetical protein M5U19_06910 [Microthrixaceae bacterium]|nr:hypothetical protein [Microthrixaceae bacterium]
MRTVAAARLMMPASVVRLSAGRAEMTDELQALCFHAGAGSVFLGDRLLTTDNPGEDRDADLFDRLDMRPAPTPHPPPPLPPPPPPPQRIEGAQPPGRWATPFSSPWRGATAAATTTPPQRIEGAQPPGRWATPFSSPWVRTRSG